ncbi:MULTISPECIES: gephyrin-like molybdotransferase Glp [unclassified Chelatococcus]|uniref:molybdopterin molybdotransferase MoeA n=1 Tax=unclassified Chelatococcus TaxID=2638111 RepID=UPI000307E3B1|nr:MULTISPECIES: gephyrin-like molybdotransferase Glp [unclassified Chelatococcus]ALA18437.1 molybdopterin biosynthesis protein MoeA [Chelatococcus sp. CO-6]
MAQLSDDCFAFGGPLMSVEEALALIGERIAPIDGVEDVLVRSAEGRVLGRDAPALVDLPPFDNSAVDGWAVRHGDLAREGETRLPAAGRVIAGSAAAAMRPGHAVRIFTGAPMPAGADTVFMQEDVTLDGGTVVLPPGLKRGANCRKAGEDIARGAVALPAGRLLRPQDLALAAAVGHASLPVRRPLRVAVFSTGNELVEPGEPLPAAGIYDSNRFALIALLGRLGVAVSDLGVLRDEPERLREALMAASGEHDLILTSGGVSTGEEDHVRAAVEAAGRLVFWRLAIKPGRPVAMGVIAGTPFVGLPGNPVAVYVTFTFVVRPLLARLMGAELPRPLAIPARAAFAYRKKAGRREFVRVSLRRGADGAYEAVKYPRDGAGVLTSLTETDGLAVLPEDMTGLAEGDRVDVYPYALLG